MDAGTQRIAATLGVVLGICLVASAAPVRIYGGDFALPIPASTSSSKGWMNDAIIQIPDHFIVADLDVSIDITHSKVFDLQIFVQSPTGGRLCLNSYNISEYFDGENYTQTIFDDEAQSPIEQGGPPFTGRFRPESGGLLSIFDGQDAFGDWRLQVYDWWDADTGMLDNVQLIVTIPEPNTAILFSVAAGSALSFRGRRNRLFSNCTKSI